MFGGILGLGMLVSQPILVSEDDIKIFKDRYCPQIVLINRMVAQNYKSSRQGWDSRPCTELSGYETFDRKNAFYEYLKRTLPEADYTVWYEDANWRYQCWDYLDDVINANRYADPKRRLVNGLNNLRKLLGPERFAQGWMPETIPSLKNVEWLHFLWTESSGFQGRLNNHQGVSPLD